MLWYAGESLFKKGKGWEETIERGSGVLHGYLQSKNYANQ